jgi:hypothetical protein
MSEIVCHRRLTEITAYVTCAMADFELSWRCARKLMDSDVPHPSLRLYVYVATGIRLLCIEW